MSHKRPPPRETRPAFLEEELSALRSVAAACIEEPSEDRLIERVTETISSAFHLSNFGIVLLEEETGTLRDHLSYRYQEGGKELSLRLGEGIVGTVAASGLPIRASDISKEPAYLEGNPLTRSELCVPLKAGGRVLGVINAESPDLNAFKTADEHLLVTLAGLLAPALVRLRDEQAIRLSDERHRVLYEDNPAVYFMVDPRGIILSVNRSGAEQLGYTASELVGRPLDRICHMEDRNGLREHLEGRLEHEGEVAHWEGRKVRKDGSLLWVKTAARAIRPPQGAPVILLACEDITHSRDAEGRYRGIFENANEGIMLATSEGLILDANPAMARMLGDNSVQDLLARVTDVGKQIYADEDLRKTLIQRLTAKGPVRGVEAKFRRKDGGYVWVSLSLGAVRDAEGTIVAVEGLVTDIMDRKEAENRLLEAQKQLKAVIEGSSIPQFFIGRDRRVVYWNRALEACTGIMAKDVVGTDRHWTAFYPEERPCLADLLVGDSIPDISTLYEGKAGPSNLLKGAFLATDFFPALGSHGRWLSFTAVAIRDSNGQTMGALETLEDITERKRAEEALRESEERYRLLVELSPYAIVVHSGGRIVFVNPACVRLTGADSAADLLGKPLMKFVHPDFRRTVRDRVSAMFRDGKPVPLMEETFLRMDGSSFPVEVASGPLTYQGHPAIQSAFRDITERTRRENLLRLQGKAFETMQLGVTITNPEGVILYTNQAEAKMHGYESAEELLGREARALSPKTLWGRPPAEQKSWVRESLNIRKDGSTFPVRLVTDPVVTEAGRCIGTVTLCEDIEARRALEAKLKKLSIAVEQSQVSLIMANMDGTIEYVNPCFTEVTGYEASEVIGKNPSFLKSGMHDGAFYKDLWDTITMGGVWLGHFINRRKDGALIEQEATISSIRDSAGNLTGFIALEKDVTEEVALRQKLVRAQEMEILGRLVAAVAHEVRNPLNAIQATADVLDQDLRSNPDLAPMLNIIHTQVDRLALLMSDLLELGKPVPTASFRRESVDDLLASSGRIWAQSRKPGTCDVLVKLTEPGGLFLDADAPKLQQVILNLLENASQHSPDKRRIILSARAEAGQVVITVRDAGQGIAPSDIPKVFQPFFTKRKGGTGLGLSLVQQIVEAHGGSVSIENNDPPPGCTVTLRLPAAREDA